MYYKDMFEYMEKNNCKDDIFTVKELLEYVGGHEDFHYDLEHDCAEYEEGHEKIDEIVSDNIDKIYDSELNVGEDKLWCKLIDQDQIDILKEKFDDIDWTSKVDTFVNYNSGRYYLMQIATIDKTRGGSPKCYEWFRTKDFQEKFINIDNNVVENFHILEKLEMLNSEIEEEYDYVRTGDDMGLM